MLLQIVLSGRHGSGFLLNAAMDEMFVRLTASRRRQKIVEDAVACGLPLNDFTSGRVESINFAVPAMKRATVNYGFPATGGSTGELTTTVSDLSGASEKIVRI